MTGRLTEYDQRQVEAKKQRQAAFLAALRGDDGGEPQSVRLACKAAGVVRSTVRMWTETDPEFRALYDDAFEDGTDTLEDVAVDRAINGAVVERTFDQETGETLSEKRKHSDQLLTFMLAGRRGRYRQGGDVNVSVSAAAGVKPADDQQIARALALILAQAQATQLAGGNDVQS